MNLTERKPWVRWVVGIGIVVALMKFCDGPIYYPTGQYNDDVCTQVEGCP